MHIGRLLERFLQDDLHLQRRSPDDPTSDPGILTGILPSTGNTIPQQQTTTAGPIPTTAVTVETKTQTRPATTENKPNTQPAPTTQQPSTTTAKATTTAPPPTTDTPTPEPSTSSTPPPSESSPPESTPPSSSEPVALITSSSVSPGAPSYTAEIVSSSASAKSTSSDFGAGFGGNGNNVGVAVGVVVGIVGGFGLIVMGVFFWRRHRRRQQLERLGSMEELARAPSPPLLSRSLTRGHGTVRKPLDDDDDFLTPMDTLPNTHRMDEYNTKYSPEDVSPIQTASFFSDDKNSFHTEYSGYDPDAHAMSNLPPSFPVPPPAAVVPANPRFYNGEMGSRPGTAQSGARSENSGGYGGAYAGSNNNSSGEVPSYSSMSKYKAYTPTGGAESGSSSPPPVGAALTSNTRAYSNSVSSSRPGGAY